MDDDAAEMVDDVVGTDDGVAAKDHVQSQGPVVEVDDVVAKRMKKVFAVAEKLEEGPCALRKMSGHCNILMIES
jgi:hypothetical protein